MGARHLGRRALLLLACALAVALVPAVASSETAPTIEAHSGSEGNSWKPPGTTVGEGASANVTNPTGVAHGLEWRSGPATPTCTSGVPVGTTPAASGTHWSGSCTFTRPGTYTFFCTVHGSEMTETVTVTKTGGPSPAVTKVSPAKGPPAGKTTVTITGTNFTGATGVAFGATRAPAFTVKSATSITASTPAEAAGAVDVTVTTPGGTSATSSKDRFTFGPPTVTKLNPNAGSKAGGITVIVSGTGFAPGTGTTTFKFGATPGSNVNCSSTTACTVTSPVHAVGKVDVRATVSGLTSAKSARTDQFTYS